MQKRFFFLFMMSVILLAGCSSDEKSPDEDDDLMGGGFFPTGPSTEVYVMGVQLRELARVSKTATETLTSIENPIDDCDEGQRDLDRGNIEVDIHQQQHTAWDKVKISIHIRDLVDSARVEIPIGEDNISETDAFEKRTYLYTCGKQVLINGNEYTLESDSPVRVSVEHWPTKYVVVAECTDVSFLNALRREFEDGVKIEVHSHLKGISRDLVWSRLKQSKVEVFPEEYENLKFKGATSAFFDN